jgi:hypothetical protein
MPPAALQRGATSTEAALAVAADAPAPGDYDVVDVDGIAAGVAANRGITMSVKRADRWGSAR